VSELVGRTVRVYRNLHKSRSAGRPVYSIKDKGSGRVVGHSDRVVLRDARFLVSEAGRQRVLRERRKNVHAYIEGTLIGMDVGEQVADESLKAGLGMVVVRYNPYEDKGFVEQGAGTVVRSAELVRLSDEVVAFNGA